MNKRKSITLLVISIVLIVILGVMTFCPVVVPLGNVDLSFSHCAYRVRLGFEGRLFRNFRGA